jgi:hypothetical protein
VKEKDETQYKKLYLCELILTYLLKMIEKCYIEQNKEKFVAQKDKKVTKKINKTLAMKGIVKFLLYDFLHASLTIH